MNDLTSEDDLTRELAQFALKCDLAIGYCARGFGRGQAVAEAHRRERLRLGLPVLFFTRSGDRVRLSYEMPRTNPLTPQGRAVVGSLLGARTRRGVSAGRLRGQSWFSLRDAIELVRVLLDALTEYME